MTQFEQMMADIRRIIGYVDDRKSCELLTACQVALIRRNDARPDDEAVEALEQAWVDYEEFGELPY